MRKLARNRKAVSPVLSTILLILIAVLGMSAAFGYFVNFVRDYQAGRGGSVMELISIEDVWFKAGTNAIEVWVYNYGKVDVKINTLYIDGQLVNFSNVTVSVGGHKDLTVQTQWVTGITYHLKLVTERGSVFEGEYASPDT